MAQASDLLAQAEKLAASAQNALDYRLVIQTAYYAAFHAAREFEEQLPHRSDASHPGSHESLLQRLERPHRDLDYGLRVVSQEVGAELRMLKPLRELATYELDEAVTIHQVEEAMRAAKEIFSECTKARQKLRRAK